MKPNGMAWSTQAWRVVFSLVVIFGLTTGLRSDEAPPSESVVPRVFRVYPLHRAPAPEWVELLRGAVGPEAHILAGQRAELYVRATPADHAVIEDMLKALDRPVRNVRIAVTLLDDADERYREFGVTGAGEIALGDAVSARFQAFPRIVHSDTRFRSMTVQTLLTIDGGSASLSVGEEIPYAEWIVRWGREWGYLEQQIQVQPVGAFLTVEPHILGEGPLIRIRLTPELRYRTGTDDPRAVRFTRLSTEVTVRDGETLDLGGLVDESDFYRRFLVGRDRSGRTRTLRLLLSPRLE